MITLSSIESDVVYGLGLLSSFGVKVDVVGIYSGSDTTNTPSAVASSGIFNSIINAIIPNTSFGQLFANARPLKATVRETSKVMEHPVETGVMLADHHIINPVEIELPLWIQAQNYAGTYIQIRQAFINATPLTVKTRTGVYNSMIIVDMPHDEDPDIFDAIILTLRLRQVIIVVPGTTTVQSNYQPLSPLNSNTIASGLQAAIAPASQLLSAASGVASYANLAKFL